MDSWEKGRNRCWRSARYQGKGGQFSSVHTGMQFMIISLPSHLHISPEEFTKITWFTSTTFTLGSTIFSTIVAWKRNVNFLLYISVELRMACLIEENKENWGRAFSGSKAEVLSTSRAAAAVSWQLSSGTAFRSTILLSSTKMMQRSRVCAWFLYPD